MMEPRTITGVAGYFGTPPEDPGSSEAFLILLAEPEGVNNQYTISCAGSDARGGYLSYTQLYLEFQQGKTHHVELSLDHEGKVNFVKIMD